MESNNSNQVLMASLIRGLIIALATGVIAGGTALSTGSDDRTAAITAVVAFSGALLARLSEGQFDSNRAKQGNFYASDVGRGITTVTVSEPAPPKT